MPKDKYGSFYDGDAYLVLSVSMHTVFSLKLSYDEKMIIKVNKQ